MIVHNFHFFRIGSDLDEADTPLVIDANAVLTGSVSFQCFQSVAGRHAQTVKTNSGMELEQFSQRGCLDIRGKLPGDYVLKHFFRFEVAEADNHSESVSHLGTLCQVQKQKARHEKYRAFCVYGF